MHLNYDRGYCTHVTGILNSRQDGEFMIMEFGKLSYLSNLFHVGMMFFSLALLLYFIDPSLDYFEFINIHIFLQIIVSYVNISLAIYIARSPNF